MKTLKFFRLLLTVLLFTSLITSCSDDDKDPDMICTFTSDSTIEVYIGQQIEVKVLIENDTYQQSDISFFMGDIEISTFDRFIYSVENEYTYRLTVPKGLTAFDEVVISLRTKSGHNVQGPKIKIVPSYTSCNFGIGNLGIRNMEMSWNKDNKITTLSSGFEVGLLKNVHFEGNTINSNGSPEIVFSWDSNMTLPTLSTGATAVTSLTGNRFGFDTRNGASYFHLYYNARNSSKGEYRLLQENFGQTSFVGDGFYQQNFEGDIRDIRVDKDQNIYLIDQSKPNCIQKLSATKAPIVWVGSATEGGNVDGTLTNARFEGVVRMQRDSKDNLYVAQKNVIRKITPQGVVTTLDKFQFEDIATFAIAPDDKIYVLDNKDQSKLYIINAVQSEIYGCTVLDYYNKGEFQITSNNMIVDANGVVYYKNFLSAVNSTYLYILLPN